MDEIHANYLRDHHGYETWRTPDDEGAPVVSGFTPGPEQMPGWQPVRVDPVPFEGARSATQSIWRPVQGEGALLRLDLIEVTSSGHARAMLLRLLGEFQSPELRRREGIGDVAFEMPGSSCILFARRKPRLGNWTRPFERQGARRTESDTTPSLVGGGQVHRHAYGCRENPTHVSQVPMTVASVLTTARVRLTASRSPAVEGGGAAPEGGAGRGTLPRRHVTRSRAKGFSLLVPHRHTASRLTLR